MRIARLTLISFGAVALCGTVLAISPGTASAKERQTISDEAGHLLLSVGDKLKINFYEQLDGTSSGLIDRPELTGDYMIQIDGSLQLPMLGSQKIQGLAVSEAQAVLEAAFRDTFKRPGRVSVALAGRNPVYVVGQVTKSGSYEFLPGMTVMHAVAQSGGTRQLQPTDLYDIIRERQKLADAQARQMRMRAKLDALDAERASTEPRPSQRLVDSAGAVKAATLVSEQWKLRSLAADALKLRLSAIEATIAAAERELKIQTERLEKMQDNATNKEQRAQMLEKLAAKGTGGSYQMLQAKSEYSDFQERISEVRSIISQVESRRGQALNDRSRLLSESRLDLEREIATTQEQASEIDRQVAMSTQLLLLAGNVSLDHPDQPRAFQYIISRPTPAGPNTFEADEDTQLHPGDLVKVVPSDHAADAKLLMGANAALHDW